MNNHIESSDIVPCPIPTHKNFKNLTRKTFGRLIVEALAGKQSNHRRYFWNCRCVCGTPVIVEGTNLRSGNTSSCGCIRIEALVERNTIHGCAAGKQTSEYGAWLSMKQRCYNQNNKGFHHYGGRGITVCDRWRDSFENLRAG